ncbi:receptor 12 [Olea europaea subsp. europaea]|uniref:Receptor 12 n=1 Tax=Olea europaea subsp. europaea TaxID=158383 RepID=A0A8S0S4D6_OLEEU|nr:receptor 12 [Olea europaea subsp. europaea]
MELKILQLLLFLCMNLLVSGVGAAAEVKCIERERQALLKFKESLTGDLSGLTWGSEEDKEECCNWYGVECSVTGHVIRLDLSDKHLRGTISPALQELQHLKYLSLKNNNMTIDNLNWLSDVPLLSYLDLSGINLRNVTNWVQPITKLSLLEILYLSGCQLRDNLPAFDFFANSSSSCLSDLYLSDNDLTSFSTLESMFNFSRILTHLDLSYNQLDSPVLGTLLKLHFLEELNLEGELPSSWKNCTKLRKLDVGRNKLTGTIPAWIGTHLTNLAVLNLRFNSFRGTIPPTICGLTNIHVLDLSRNNISGIIPRCLNNFTSLVRNDGSTILEFNPSLVYAGKPFDDNDNALVQWKGQDSEYKRLKNLKGIDVSSNKLVGTIPQAFSNLKGLVFINLSRNYLTGNIISSIGQLDTLKWIDLSRNQLSGEIPNSLANLHFLSVLYLSYNNLTGKIPLSTQLQSFNSSAYVGNSLLCGDSLAECPHDPSMTDRGELNIVEEDDRFMNRDFYICMAFGFITGFWVIVGTLVLKHSWRRSYFNFWNNIGDWIHVTTAIYVTRFKRKFMP